MPGLLSLVLSVVVTVGVVVLILSVERRRAEGIRRDLRADALRDRRREHGDDPGTTGGRPDDEDPPD